MKTVKIPTYNNPFIVIINNKAYRYTAGDTVEVPDEVAEAIEDALELVPTPKRYLSKIAQLAECSLPELTFSDLEGIETIAYCAFAQCYSLTRIEIPNSVTKIRKNAFLSCTGLKSVILGDNSKLNRIEENAFSQCVRIERIYLPETPPTLANVNAFTDINPDCVFYCKTPESLDAYKTAPNWSTLTGTYSFVVEA